MNAYKHLWVILIVFVVALVAALAIKYHQSLEDIWLWLIGLSGGIAEIIRRFGSKISSLLSAGQVPVVSANNVTVPASQPSAKNFPDPLPLASQGESKPQEALTTSITVLRYADDGETTLGLLYIDNKFFCYTLEDTFREVKVHGKTRIPAGSYKLDFIRQVTPLTLTYRQTRDWFDYHLEIKNVAGFTGVYVHNGGTSADTEGCLLIADGISANDETKTLTNSRQTFEEFYKLIGNRLRNNYSVQINIYNENWIDQLKN